MHCLNLGARIKEAKEQQQKLDLKGEVVGLDAEVMKALRECNAKNFS